MEEINTDKNQRWVPTKKFFSDALLVAILTAAGYLAAFAYQFFYLYYFHIPVFFVNITLENVLFTTAIGFLVSSSIAICVDIIISYEIKNKWLDLTKTIFMVFLILFIIFIPILALYFNINNNIVFIITLIIIAILVGGIIIYAKKIPIASRIGMIYSQ